MADDDTREKWKITREIKQERSLFLSHAHTNEIFPIEEKAA